MSHHDVEGIITGLEISRLFEGDLQNSSWSSASLDSDDLTVPVVDQGPHHIGELDDASVSKAVELNDFVQVLVEEILYQI